MRGVLLFAVLLASPSPKPTVEVKVTQKHLVPLCLDGAPVEGARRWRLSLSQHSLAFTMKNEPRHPAPEATPGIAAIRFTPVADHRYEIEVRAEPVSFSTRTWNRGDWRPVVRDRTTDEIVSGEPEWREEACR
jgi:hypothetical protein